MTLADLKRVSHLIVRKDHVLCTRCATIEPVYPGDGVPVCSFVTALAELARRHQTCSIKNKVDSR